MAILYVLATAVLAAVDLSSQAITANMTQQNYTIREKRMRFFILRFCLSCFSFADTVNGPKICKNMSQICSPYVYDNYDYYNYYWDGCPVDAYNQTIYFSVATIRMAMKTVQRFAKPLQTASLLTCSVITKKANATATREPA